MITENGIDISNVLVMNTKLFDELYISNLKSILEKIGEYGSYTIVRIKSEDSI